MKKYRQVITELNTNGFEPIPHPRTRSRDRLALNVQTMRANLWSMFDLPSPACIKVEQISVSEYAWTQAVKDAFYAWGDHPSVVRDIKRLRGMDWGMWVLNVEPADYDILEA